MGLLQNQNLTLDSSGPDVTYWETPQQLSPAARNAVVALGVLTFALQLCLAVFCLLRCWRLDRKVRAALENPDDKEALWAVAPPPAHVQTCWRSEPRDDVAAPPATAVGEEEYEPEASAIIPWDLVQH